MKKINSFLKSSAYFGLGLGILIGIYFICTLLTEQLNLRIPPAILGIILLAGLLTSGIIKEKWIKTACEILIKNMAMFLVPFFGGLIVYKSMFLNNWPVLVLVILVTTTLTIVFTGIFVDKGLKYLRLYKMKKSRNL